jgi:hypothetical protein
MPKPRMAGPWVALCINSGQAVDEQPPVVDNILYRIDYSGNTDFSRFEMNDVVADEIWLWNTADNVTKHVKIPQIDAPMIVCNKFIQVLVIFVLTCTFQAFCSFSICR